VIQLIILRGSYKQEALTNICIDTIRLNRVIHSDITNAGWRQLFLFQSTQPSKEDIICFEHEILLKSGNADFYCQLILIQIFGAKIYILQLHYRTLLTEDSIFFVKNPDHVLWINIP